MTKRKSKYYQTMRKTYLKVKIRGENLSKNKLVCKNGVKIVDCGAGLGGGGGEGGWLLTSTIMTGFRVEKDILR